MTDEQIPDDVFDDSLEREAREMGWVPREEYKGDPDHWRDADEFVERGRSILPILQANNKRLKNDLLTRDQEIANLKKAVEDSSKAIKALQRGYNESVKLQVENARKELRDQLRAAKETGDIDAELAITDKLADLKSAERSSKEDAVEEDKAPANTPQLDPEFVAWNKENPWFGNMNDSEDRKRTRALVRIGEDLRDEGDKTYGRAFMEKCIAELEKQEGKQTSRTSNKVEGGSRSSGGSSSGRAYDRLPKEAKDTCKEQAEDFVGPGKMFKNEREWQDYYANLYGE